MKQSRGRFKMVVVTVLFKTQLTGPKGKKVSSIYIAHLILRANQCALGYVLKLIVLVIDLIWLPKVGSKSVSTPRFWTWSLVGRDSDLRDLLTAMSFSFISIRGLLTKGSIYRLNRWGPRIDPWGTPRHSQKEERDLWMLLKIKTHSLPLFIKGKNKNAQHLCTKWE